jgi:hypothetical protein
MDEQPLPIKNTSTPIVDLVIRDLERYQTPVTAVIIDDLWARKRLGIERYGAALQAHNGRDAHRDAYEEAMDLVVYLRQCVEEKGSSYYPLYIEAVGIVLSLRKMTTGIQT